MSENEIERIAELVAQKVNAHPAACKVFSDEEISGIKSFFLVISKTKSIAFAAFIGFIVIGFCGLLISGFGAWVVRVTRGQL